MKMGKNNNKLPFNFCLKNKMRSLFRILLSSQNALMHVNVVVQDQSIGDE